MRLTKKVKESVNAVKSYVRSQLTGDKPYKPLIEGMQRTGGRNNTGRITVRHKIAGGNRINYRLISFNRKNQGEGTIMTIEKDPNRSSFISLVKYVKDGKTTFEYILTPKDVKKGDKILTSDSAVPIKPGNHTLLSNIPVGTRVHNISLKPGMRGSVVRSAGTSAELLGFIGNEIKIRLPSKEIRLFNNKCHATVGEISNDVYKNRIFLTAGKAIRERKGSKRVRGVKKSASAHPHGGGDDNRLSYTGRQRFGVHTRNKKKYSAKFVVKDRRRNE